MRRTLASWLQNRPPKRPGVTSRPPVTLLGSVHALHKAETYLQCSFDYYMHRGTLEEAPELGVAEDPCYTSNPGHWSLSPVRVWISVIF